MTGTIFTDVSIFDGTGRALYPGEVLVRGNTIEAVAEGDERLDRGDRHWRGPYADACWPTAIRPRT